MNRRIDRRLGILAAFILAAFLLLPGFAGETLYNGIVLPDEWPPKPEEIPRADQTTPPYLLLPPDFIPIDVGRQLFVDDFLIDSVKNLKRNFHLPEWFEGNPVLKAEHPAAEIGGRDQPMAAPFSDGVWWDPKDRSFKMWYMARFGVFTSYATSKNGIHWERPALPNSYYKGANTVLYHRGDSSTVWLDLDTQIAERRFVSFTWRANNVHLRFSANGTDWGDPLWSAPGAGDRTTFFYNPFRKVWIYSLRRGDRNAGRSRYYVESADLSTAPDLRAENVKWTRADDLDRVQPVISEGTFPDLYNVDATPYESLMLGLFSIHSVEHQKFPGDPGQPKIVHVSLGYSRDGFHWSRPDRRPFLDVNPGDKTAWNRGNVQSAGGGCLVVGDRLYFYCSGRVGGKIPDDATGMSTGLAFLRRDGFASMDAETEGGTLTTRPVVFRGGRLFVNVANPDGELKVELLSRDGKVIEPFNAAICEPVTTDSTIHPVTWKNDADFSKLAGQPVRFRFHLKKARLYSFWVSKDESGASRGYVAAGGPGFQTNRDNEGVAVYEAAQPILDQAN